MKHQDLSKQHAAIRQAILELQEDVYDEQEVKRNRLLISLRIGNLSGILLVHLQYEDQFVYPDLFNHSDQKVKDLSRRFHLEMGNLSSDFLVFQDLYLKNPETLMTHTAQFIKDTEQILFKISKRVEKEEFELYPLLKFES